MEKKILFVAIAIFFGNASLKAQSFEISPSAGYMLNGKIDFYEGILDLGDNASYGITLGMNTGATREFELDYTWSANAQVDFRSRTPLYDDFQTTINVHNITLNAVQYLKRSETVNPFFNIGAGMAIFDGKEPDVQTRTRFLVNLGLGLKYYISDRIGLRIQSRLIMPLYFSGVGFYFGGGGGGLTLNSWAPMVQGDFRGALIFRVGS